MVTRGLVLGGGGSRGAYEMGVWRAANELGISFGVVTGTSIGALNGALLIQGDYEFAKSMWEKMSYESVMSNIKGEDLVTLDGAKQVFKTALREIVAEGGMDIEPLETLVREHLSEEEIRSSPIEFGIVTVEIPSLREMEMTKENIPHGQMADYLLASAACYPAFKPRSIGQYRFVDGGYRNNLPIDLAIELGADEIWAVDLQSLGFVPEKLMYDIPVRYIRSYWDLGIFLTFDSDRIKRNMELGYLDTMKSLGYFDGYAYTFEKKELDGNIERYMQLLDDLLEALEIAPAGSPLSIITTKRMSSSLRWGKRRRNSKRTDFVRCAELAAEMLDLDPTVVYTAREFNRLISESFHQTEVISREEIEQTLRNAKNDLPSIMEVARRISRVEAAEMLGFVYNSIAEAALGRNPAINLSMIASVMPKEFCAAVYIYLIKNEDYEGGQNSDNTK